MKYIGWFYLVVGVSEKAHHGTCTRKVPWLGRENFAHGDLGRSLSGGNFGGKKKKKKPFKKLFFKITVKPTEHKICHLNHFKAYCPVALSTFMLLYNHHCHLSLELIYLAKQSLYNWAHLYPEGLHPWIQLIAVWKFFVKRKFQKVSKIKTLVCLVLAAIYIA